MSAARPCYLHPRREASLTCDLCRRPICNSCVHSADARLTCPACLDDARRGRLARRVALGVLALLVVGGLGVGVWSLRGDDAPTATDGQDPAQRYARALLDARRTPDDPQRWLRVAEILIEQDRLAAAEAPLRRALSLAPDDPALNARLGYFEYERGREAEALAILEKAEALGADDPALGSTLSAIRARMAADEEERQSLARAEAAAALARARAERARAEAFTEAAGAAAAEAERRRFDAEACSMPVERRGNHFIVRVGVNGVEAELIYDTGATGLMLSHEMARRAGLDLDPADTLEAQTANGTAYFLRSDVASLTVAGGELQQVRCAVCRAGDPCLGPKVDGLLGVRVMEAMGMSLDAAGSRIRFAQCD